MRSEARDEWQANYANELQKIALSVWQRESKDEYSYPPVVAIQSGRDSDSVEGDIVMIRSDESKRWETRRAETLDVQISNAKLKAITQILASFGLLEKLSEQEKQRLLNAIYQVLETSE